MKVLILGSNGLLGNTLSLFLKKKNIKLFFISRKKKSSRHFYIENLKNFDKLKKLIQNIEPNYIINCVGITHHHKSYKSKKETRIINTSLPIYLSNLCLKKKIYFLHISTDCVYSGSSGYYSEKSKKNPKGYYGLTKSKGEVKNLYTATLRTSFIGPELKNKNQLLNWFLNQKNEVNGFTKAFFSGLTSLELSFIIYNFFIKSNIYYNEIINVGGPKISKYKLLVILSKFFRKKLKINKDKTYIIDRSLNSDKFKRLTKYKQKSWPIMIKSLKRFMIANNYKF